ncbi:MAG TPA: energy transducer TonB [Longimicrobium sp.]
MINSSPLQAIRGAGRMVALAGTFALAFAASPVHAQMAPLDKRIWDAEQVTQKPVLVNAQAVGRMISHSYPRQLLDSGVPGMVTLELTLGTNGQVEQVAVVDASRREFGDVARGLARAMRFTPAKVDGEVVRSRVTVPVEFMLVSY